MLLWTTVGSSCCRTMSGPSDSWLLVTFLCLTLSSPLEASISTKGPNTKGCTANVNDWLLISVRLMEMSEITLQQFKKVFNCTLGDNPTQDPGNEQMIKNACMEGTCYSGKKYHQINHNSQTFTSCRDTIYKILMSYVTDIKYLDSPDLLNAVNDMMQALNDNHVQPLSSPQRPLTNNFEVQMKQCNTLLILQQLFQTIHRNLSYIKNIKK